MEADQILERSSSSDVAFLVVGDPFGATTHSDLVMRATKCGIPTKTIHNASVMNSIAECGLQLYCFGPTVSIPFFTDTWKPASFYDKVGANISIGCHTLCLLDIKVKEQSVENLLKGVKIYEPPRYMTVNQALNQIHEVEENLEQKSIRDGRIIIGIARLGSDDQIIACGRMDCLRKFDFGGPLHCLIIPGKMHECEFELLQAKYCVDSKEGLTEAYKRFHK